MGFLVVGAPGAGAADRGEQSLFLGPNPSLEDFLEEEEAFPVTFILPRGLAATGIFLGGSIRTPGRIL